MSQHAGYRRQGDSSLTIQNAESEVKNPWAICWGCIKADAVMALGWTGAVYAIVYLVGLLVTYNNGLPQYWPPWYVRWLGSDVIGFARLFGYTFGGLWRAYVLGLFAPLIWWLTCSVPRHRRLLVKNRWETEQKDPFYFGSYTPRDSSERGRTYEDDWNRHHQPPPEPEPIPRLVPSVMVERDNGDWDDIGAPPLPKSNGQEKLVTVLRRVMNRIQGFNRQDVMAIGFHKKEWEALAEWAISAGFHEKGSGGLTPAGKRWAVRTLAAIIPDPPTPSKARDGGNSTPPDGLSRTVPTIGEGEEG